MDAATPDCVRSENSLGRKHFTEPHHDTIKLLSSHFPCRDRQIRALISLLQLNAPSPKNIVLYGLTATGKSSVVRAVVEQIQQKTSHIDDNRRENYVGEYAEGNPNNDPSIHGTHEFTRTKGDGLGYVVVNSQECITGRHLLERTAQLVAKAVDWEGRSERCEDIARLVELLEKYLSGRGPKWGNSFDEGKGGMGGRGKFVVVLDGIDRQLDAPATLLPALGRLGELIPNLVMVFVVTNPRPQLLHTSAAYVHFPSYTKAEALHILSLTPPPIETITGSRSSPESHEDSAHTPPAAEKLKNLYTRFLAAVWDTFASHSGRDLLSFRYLATQLWPKFTAPVRDGRFLVTDFQRLFISQRALFRDESILVPLITNSVAGSGQGKGNEEKQWGVKIKALTSAPPLSYASQILLLAAYLCSYIPARMDVTIFSKASSKKKRRGGVTGGGARKSKNSLAQRRKIDRKLLGPQAFVVERLLAVFWCVWEEAEAVGRDRGGSIAALGGGGKGIRELGGSADILAQVATLASLRLLVKSGSRAEELEGGGKWRVNVGWEVIRGVGRGVGVELGEWLAE